LSQPPEPRLQARSWSMGHDSQDRLKAPQLTTVKAR